MPSWTRKLIAGFDFVGKSIMGMYTKYLVCYDISNNKRRQRFSDVLKNLGFVPMQKSVFYGDIRNAEISALARAATELLEANEDRCFWFACYLKPDEIRKCLGYANWNYVEPEGYGVI